MCGIVGLWDLKNKINPELLKRMRDRLEYRGPDDAGLYIDEQNNVGLGHRRLSIIDLSAAGHQPMGAEGGDPWIVYNGEVYNFQEIKKELRSRGYDFFSDSDTEVVLRSWQEWGIGAVQKFRGMFAFALWDKKKQELVLVRDRPGVKPLYYYFNPEKDLFIFASEIKAILFHPTVKGELDPDALRLFLRLSYIPAPFSIFKNIFKLEPGHILKVKRQKAGLKIEKIKYWDVFDFYEDNWDVRRPEEDNRGYEETEEAAVEKMEEILTESFNLRMVADVEVGHFLSGGLDSSLVAAILVKKLGFKNLKTFTIGFRDEKLNEARYAREIAEYLGTDHHELFCTEKEAMEVLPKLAEIYDEPFGDSSAIPTYLVSQFARKYVKVSLSADGGDETFCGYDRYWVIDSIFRKFQKIPNTLLKAGLFLINAFPAAGLKFLLDIFGFFLPKQIINKKKIYKLKRKINKLKEIAKRPDSLLDFYLLLGFGYWKEPELSRLLSPVLNSAPRAEQITGSFWNDRRKMNQLDNLSQMQAFDYKTYLVDDILVKVDRATMANSLEGRDPLLDHKIIEYAAQLPVSFKYKNGVSKRILRKILYKYIPKELLDRPKQGFTVPLEKWLRGDLKFLLDKYLNEERIKRQGIFNWQVIKEEKEKFLNKSIDYAEHLWLLIVFEIWREKWLS